VWQDFKLSAIVSSHFVVNRDWLQLCIFMAKLHLFCFIVNYVKL